MNAQRAEVPEEIAPPVEKVKWQANFRGADKGKDQRDEFHRDATCRPSTSVYAPVEQTVWMSAIAEYDIPEKMLNKGSRGTKGRTLKQWVLKVISANQRIKWQMPATAASSRKRKARS